MTKQVRAGNAYVELGLRAKLDKGIKAATRKLRAFGRSATAIGAGILGSGAAAAAPLALAVATFASFDDAMLQTRAVTRATAEEFEDMSSLAAELGRTTSFTATEVGGLMTELGRAGFDPTQIDAMTGSVLSLARATGTEAVAASGIMSASIRQFGLDADEATRVADGLTAAANMSFNTVDQIGEALSYAGPVARDFNMSFEDTLAVLGGLGNVGIQGSAAGTAVRRLLTLTGAEAQKLQKIFGVSFVDAAGNARPLVDVLGEVDEATKDLGSAERAAKFNEAFGLLGITGASAIGRSAGDIAKLADDIKAAGGIAGETAEQMDSGLGGSFRILKSAAEGVAIAIGGALAPPLSKLAKMATSLLGVIASWIDENRGLVATLFGVAVAVATAGAGLVSLGFISTALSVAIPIVVGGLVAVGKFLLAMAAPAAIAIAVLGSIAAVAYYNREAIMQWGLAFWDALLPVREVMGQIWSIVKTTFGGIGDVLKEGDFSGAAAVLWAGVQAIFFTGAEGAIEAFNWLKASVFRILKSIGTKISGVVGNVLSRLGSVGQSIGEYFAGVGFIISAAFNFIKETLGGIASALMGGNIALAGQILWATLTTYFTAGTGLLTQLWMRFVFGLKEHFSTMGHGIVTIFRSIVSTLAYVMESVFGKLQKVLTKVSKFDKTGAAKGLAAALGATATVFDVAQDELAKRQKTADDQRNAERLARNRAFEKELVAIHQRTADAKAKRDELIRRANEEGGDVTVGKLKDASLAQLNALVKRTKQEAKVIDDDKVAKAEDQKAKALGKGKDLAGKSGKTTAGSFSALGAQLLGLGGSSAAEETATNTRKTAEILQRIENKKPANAPQPRFT